jgi:hypothetical protein
MIAREPIYAALFDRVAEAGGFVAAERRRATGPMSRRPSSPLCSWRRNRKPPS